MKKIAVALGVTAVLTLAGCGSGVSSDSANHPTSGRSASYSVVADWTLIPADNDAAVDIWVRTIKIENVCYLQSGSVRDWTYQLTPLASC